MGGRRLLHRLWVNLSIVDLVVRSLRTGGFAFQQGLHDGERLGKPSQANAAGFEGNTQHAVVLGGVRPASANA